MLSCPYALKEKNKDFTFPSAGATQETWGWAGVINVYCCQGHPLLFYDTVVLNLSIVYYTNQIIDCAAEPRPCQAPVI